MNNNPASILYTHSGVQLSVYDGQSITTSGLHGLVIAANNGTQAEFVHMGQQLMTDSLAVVLASDQTIAVSTSPAGSINGFIRGDVSTAALTTVAVRSTTYNEQTTDAQRSLVSSSVLDTAAGTGARTVKIIYFTSTGVGPLTETVTLNGILPVNTVATNICFIEEMEVVTAGSGGLNAGTITLAVSTGGLGGTLGTIAIGNNITLWCHHYIATGKTARITAQWAGHDGTTVGSGATFVIRMRPIGITNAVEIHISDKFRLYGQSSSVQRNYGTPITIPGPARLLTYVTPETSTSINYRASFDFYES